MKKKLILFIVGSLGGGGAEKFIITLLQGLNQEKYDVHLCIIKGQGANDKFIPKYVYVHRLYKTKVLRALFSVSRLIVAIKPDIVFSSMFHVNIMTILSSYIIYPNKMKLIVRESTIPSYRFGLSMTGLTYSVIMKVTYRSGLITNIITQCEAMRNDLVINYNLPESKLLVINNPVNHDDLLKKSQDMLKYKIDTSVINMISIGRLENVKGYDRMIEIFTRLERNKYHLYICGEGSQRGTLLRMISDYGLNDEVSLTGFLSNPYSLLSEMQLFLLSSRSDSFPNATLESLALGVPVIAYDCPGGVNEILNSPDNGVLIDDGDISNYVKSINEFRFNQYEPQYLIKTSRARYGNNIIESYEYVFDSV
jgi:glycosyltransferase involved in cell wall biosynthesis